LTGDFLAFLAASSVVERYVELKDSITGEVIEYKNITTVKKEHPNYLLNTQDYQITDAQRLKKNYLGSAKAIMINKVNKFKKATRMY